MFVSPVAPDQGARPETPPAPQSVVTVAPAAAEQLFLSLPAAASRPLQAVSAPLTALALSTSSSQLVSMQSLSDPTVSVIQTPSKVPASQAQLPASVALQGPAAAAASSKEPARTRTVADAAGPAPSDRARQQHDSAAAATLDLAAVLAPGPRAEPGQMPPAAAGVVGSSSTPAAPTARWPHERLLACGQLAPAFQQSPRSPGHLGAAAEQGTAGSATSNLLYGVAPARPLPTSSLFKSPLAHVTLSVKVCIAPCQGLQPSQQSVLPASIRQSNCKASALFAPACFLLPVCDTQVPHQFTPSAASNLQSTVARHVWAGEPQLAGPNGEPRDPQHTILHMVSIPGCIQLFLTVAQWQPEHGAPAGGPPHTLAGPPHHNRDSCAGADAQAAAGPAAGGAGDAAALRGAPAPAWLIQAVCSAVEEFCRTHPQAPSLADGPSSTAGQQEGASGQHYTGPVLLNVDGVVHTLQLDATNPAAAWVLQPLSEQELTQLQAGPHFSTGLPTAAAAAAAAATAQGQPPVLWQGSRASAAVAGSGADPAASPETLAVTVPAHAACSPLTQLLSSQQPSLSTSPDSSTSACSSSPTPAAARTFIRTVAQGLVAMHDQGSHGLFAPTAPDGIGQGAITASVAQAAPTSKGITELASSSNLPRASAVLSIHTSCAPATALPPRMWGWPLYLATSGEGAASVDARLAVCGSSAVVPVVSLHGVPAGQSGSCRVVLATAAGVVLFDEEVPVEDGVARWASCQAGCCCCCCKHVNKQAVWTCFICRLP